MLYLGIDQHSKQITVCVRNEYGEAILRRQVSTQPAKIRQFFDELMMIDPEFLAILEVCGFNDWLLEELQGRKCKEIVLIHPDKTTKKKTDRRDANTLCELLWLNRQRVLAGERVQGLRRVWIPSPQDQEARQITSLRKRVAQKRTKTLNRIHRILHRHNLEWSYPTKTFQTKKGCKWLEEVSLGEMDRMEMDLLLKQWTMWNKQLDQLDDRIQRLTRKTRPGQIVSDAELLMTAPGVSPFSGLAIACRIGEIDRFPSPRALANYFGMTPGCRNSGNNNHRLGSITKEGSAIVRFVLGQIVVHILKKDTRLRRWYQRIKRRRGTKIARVAVMRKMLTIFWQMLKHREAYDIRGKNLGSGSTKGTQQTVAA